MVTTLEQGVEGGKWFRLLDKVFAERNLLAAFQQVASKHGAPRSTTSPWRRFERALRVALGGPDQLKHGTYQPQSIRRVLIPKPGTTETRPLGIPTVRDRMVQAAVVNVIAPIFERDFAEHSYGFRPGRGCKDACDGSISFSEPVTSTREGPHASAFCGMGTTGVSRPSLAQR